MWWKRIYLLTKAFLLIPPCLFSIFLIFCCCPYFFVLIKSPAMQIYHICYFSNLLSRKPVFMKLCSAYLFWWLCSASHKPTKLHKRGEIWLDGICLFRYQTQRWLFYSVLIDWEFFRCLFQDLINTEV